MDAHELACWEGVMNNDIQTNLKGGIKCPKK
jgi:hypothetical protein